MNISVFCASSQPRNNKQHTMKKILLLCAALLALAVSAKAQGVDTSKASTTDTSATTGIAKIEHLPPIVMDIPREATLIPSLRRRGYPVDYMSMKPYNMLQRPWEVIVLPGLPACIGYNENYYGLGSRFYEEKIEKIGGNHL